MVTYGNRTTTDSDAYTSHIYIVADDYVLKSLDFFYSELTVNVWHCFFFVKLVSSLQCKCK